MIRAISFILLSLVLSLLNFLRQESALLRFRSRSITSSQRLEAKRGVTDEDSSSLRAPQLAWLMSYPNSGTSYSLTMVKRATGVATATNYGDEVTAPGEKSLSVRNDATGPFWEGTSGKLGRAVRPLPRSYILTKTHCGARCVACAPEHYMLNHTTFVGTCTQSGYTQPNGSRVDDHYDANLVARVVHLIRSPFDNVVSRFHHERKRWIQNNMLKNYADTSERNQFRSWCRMVDSGLKPSERRFFGEETYALLQRAGPCHAEIVKWANWHERARQVINSLQVPFITMYYEDFAKDSSAALQILDFLKMPALFPIRSFRTLPDYQNYFTKVERDASCQLILKFISNTTFLDRYLSLFSDSVGPIPLM